jgi:hypothetical protein
MKLEIQRGKVLAATFRWVHFVLLNTDIMTALSNSLLRMKKVGPAKFQGSVFGVTLEMEALGDQLPTTSGKVRLVADIRMPAGLGKTHTIARYNYTAIDLERTSVELELAFETTAGIMTLYAEYRRSDIDKYLNQLLSDTEKAAQLLQNNDARISELDPEMRGRIDQYRQLFTASAGGPAGADRLATAAKALDTTPQFTRPWDTELGMLTTFYQSITGEERKLEDELIRIRDTRDAVATLLISRRMLELIVTQVCEQQLKRDRGSEPMAAIIDKCAREKAVPEHVVASMTNLNRLSTFGAHPKDFSVLQVREALLALCSIMEWYVQSSACRKTSDSSPAQQTAGGNERQDRK